MQIINTTGNMKKFVTHKAQYHDIKHFQGMCAINLSLEW